MLGTEKIKTTTYHPISNGIVERFHQHLKSAIKAHENDTLSEIVSIILLGIRTAVKENLQFSCAEIAYGTNPRLPSDMIDVSNIPFCDNNFITNLCNRMQQLNPVATSAHCTHILLRIDRVQTPLSQPYTGPHKVLSRTDKTITIDANGRKNTVSLDHIKTAHLLLETVCESPPTVSTSVKDDKLSTKINQYVPQNQEDIVTTEIRERFQQLQNLAQKYAFLRPEVILSMGELNLDQTPQDINKEEFQLERVRLQTFVAATDSGCKKELLRSGSLNLLKYIIESKLEDG
ncbi:transposon Ty3-G Gag-Pol polyprotein [Trichonephila clavipes]|nr:transposon Ty3-G Gag-Pol polyprotein [Trichonephila clavipes]